jgi:hypothetical protein
LSSANWSKYHRYPPLLGSLVLHFSQQIHGENPQLREPPSVQLSLNEGEAALVVAALRNWQLDIEQEDLEDAFMSHFRLHRPLSEQDIDLLCQRLNFDESQGRFKE